MPHIYGYAAFLLLNVIFLFPGVTYRSLNTIPTWKLVIS